ncbi:MULTISPECIES: TetR/AcrR family transcriptional regulator [Kordiimonas]|uniref:TetR/AcrR family transcriptional regulator n=1 Tax=Kordiimonas TaxID=288021 RepID=UPI00257B20DC|nr:TetR/AcrR family transcriptional regulator [Kordiimonas sp. UBA4487]
MSNKWMEDLEWKNPPKQSRSERTRDSLLDAAERLFGEHGADATSVTDIAKASGCSIGALYHHFKDKAALKEALFARGAQRIERSSATALDPAIWEGATIIDILKRYLEFTLQIEQESPGFKTAIKEAIKDRADLWQQFSAIEHKLFDGFRALLMMRTGEIGHPDPELAIRFIIDQCKAMIVVRCDRTTDFDQLRDVPDAVFVDEFLHSARAYLQLRK